jgi:hypothetical protein
MSLRKFLFGLFVLLISASIPVYAQRDTIGLPTIINKVIKLGNEHPIEKVYMHMDKPYYSVGDTIWFKAYVTLDRHVPSALSRIVYADVINSRDSLITAIKLPVVNGVAWGDIPLPQALFKQGNYHIVAYTNWMRNFDPAYFFNKTFSIGNVIDKELITNISLASSTKNNLSKVTARVVFKDQNGNAYANKKVSWKVTPDDDKEIKGKETTDQNGVANIVIPTGKIASLSASPLETIIDVGNKKVLGASFSLKSVVKDKDIQFFPEGGELINGLRSIVAFKAINSNGLGIDVNGTITDNEGKAAGEFKSQNLGMGKLVMVPESGKTYTANVTFADGSKGSYELPRVQISGINLAVSLLDPQNVLLKIASNDVFFQKYQGQQFYIIAQSGGIIYYAAKSTLTSQLYTASIAKNKFPTGIVQITLFAATGNPVSERIVFVQNNDGLNLSLTSTNKTFAPRQKVTLKVDAKANALPAQTNLSVSVIDESKVPVDENAETTILSSLLLTSDLKGFIEKPNYYFIHNDEKTKVDLDILMLTQGYRRVSYRDIIADKSPPVYFLPEQGIDITGTLRNQTGLPIRKGNVRLLVPDKNYSTQTITDPVGRFKFSNLFISDSSSVTLNARDNVNNASLMVTVDSQTLQGITANFNAPDEVMNIDSALRPYLQNRLRQYNGQHILKEVLIKEAAPEVKKVSHTDFPALTGLSMDPDHMITGDRLKDCTFFVSCLQTAVFGLTYYQDNFYVTRDYNAGKKVPVAIFYNGMNVDYNYLNAINAAEVESVEIFLKDELSGINSRYGTNGVLVINGKKRPEGKKMTKDQLRELFPPKYMLTIIPIGYSKTREFYSPKYIAPPSVTQKADLRSTIYWNPRLATDKTTGSTSFEFFNADAKGSYRAVVEGIDADGNIGRYVYHYKVQ